MKTKLLLVSAILLSAFVTQAKQSPIRGLIVGGGDAAQGEFPWMVSLRNKSYGHFCGGSLIAPNWVLTAAHCAKGATIDEVWIGLYSQKDSTAAEKIKPSKIIVHEKYTSVSTSGYDYALVKLPTNSSFKPVALVTEEIAISDDPTEIINSVTAGWGDLSESGWQTPDILQKVTVPLVSKAVCNTKEAYNGSVNDTMICAGFKAGGKDSCQGDSGGPLLVHDADGVQYLAGIVSWGQGCARPNKYGVYAKVSAGATWIAEKMAAHQ